MSRGRPDAAPRPDELQRVLDRTKRDESGCLIWIGGSNRHGRGTWAVGGRYGRPMIVYRYLYEQMVGPIPSGKELDHFRCDNPRCVDWKHVRPVTRRENLLRSEGIASRHAAATACPHGHDYSVANTIITRDGSRECRTCKYARNRAYKARRKVAA